MKTLPLLRSENRRLEADMEQLAKENAALRMEKEQLQWELRETKAKLQDLLRRMFGPSSEKIDPRQHQLALEAFEADARVAEVEQPAVPAAPVGAQSDKPRTKRGARRPIPSNLPVEQVVHDLPVEQKQDPVTGEPLVKIREEITEEIDYRPSRFVRIQHVVPVYAAPSKTTTPVQAKITRVIPQSGAGTGLLSHILVSKYVDHLPFYRIEQMAARQGVQLERQKMSRWTEQVAMLLQTIFNQLEQRLMASAYVQCDETPVRVLDPDRPGAAQQAFLWVRNSPLAKVILFTFDLSRGQHVPLAFFPKDWQGAVQSDCYCVYDHLAEQRPGITQFACWAHARRKWIEAVDQGGEHVAKVLALIAQLYQVETEARDMTAAQREILRHDRSQILLGKLHQQMLTARMEALPSSRIAIAANYALSRWEDFTRYAEPGFGHIHIDNNPIENGIRPTALGKKNWLFVGHPDAGWKSAVVYSILGTCKLLKLNPEDYLNWVLPQLATATNRTTGLLPHDYLDIVVKEREQNLKN